MAGDKDKNPEEPLSKEAIALKHLISRRNRAWAQLQAAYDLTKSLSTKGETFLTRCASLPQVRENFEELNSEVDLLVIKHPTLHTDNTLTLSTQFDELYFECMRLYEKHKPKTTPSPQNPGTSTSSATVQPQQLKLPQIDIPIFKGDIDSFSSFIALYDAVIQKSSLTRVEKFAYLKSKLEGEPKDIVDSIPFAQENYDTAYKALADRYNQPRILIAHHLNKILNLSPIKSDNANDLKELVSTLHVNVEAIKNMKVDDIGSQLLLQITLRLLPVKLKKEFESLRQFGAAEPSYDTLIKFLQNQCVINQLVSESNKASENTQKFTRNSPQPKSNNKKTLLATQQTPEESSKKSESPTSSCKLCSKGSHRLIKCFKFLELDPSERRGVVRDQNRCEICLFFHPSACQSKGVCKWCSSSLHNTYLCVDKVSSDKSSPSTSASSDNRTQTPSSSQTSKSANSCSVNHGNLLSSPVLLGTAQVRIKNSCDQWYGPTRVLTDSGSEVNFITESLTQILGLKRRKCPYQVTGVGQASPMEVRGIVTCTLASLYPPHQSIMIEAIVTSKISAEVPSTSLPRSIRDQFSHVSLADPKFCSRNRIDLLLGVQATHDILSHPVEIIPGHPSATKTIFGYVLSGAVTLSEPPEQHPARQSFVCQSVAPVDELLKKFWEMEEVSAAIPPSPEDEFCEEFYECTTTRTKEGRYMVSLPFKNGTRPELGSTTNFALGSFHRLETKFKRNPKYHDMYNSNIQDYFNQGYIVEAHQPVDYVLTHHGVIKDSSTSPLRVVFNPSLLSSTSQTLNECLCTGPKLQTEIGDIILNFRVNRVGMMCDVKSHYLSILLNPEDRQFQHFYYRFRPDKPIQEWEWTCVIFGMSSSPWLAQKTLKRLILDEKHRFPKASQILDSSCYVDNIVFSVNSPEEAINRHHELNRLLASGGFVLRKWASSDHSVSNQIASELKENPRPLGDTEAIRVLGLEWSPESDSFCYLVQPSTCAKSTKRTVMSQIARIYDINGYLSPFVFSMKRLLQDIWLAGLMWDDELTPELNTKWCAILESLPSLANLRIPRYIMGDVNWNSVQLIGFGDASEAGMAAVLYLRVQLSSGEVVVNVIKAKSKVSPLRKVSIPRLELGAAYILSLLVKSVQPFIESLNIEEIHLFSDSTTTLAWIHTPPYKLATYVANRVVHITDLTPISSWRFVPTDENPADLSSRGLNASELINADMWWHGPSFLYQDVSQWPSRNFVMSSEIPELKQTVQALVTTSKVANSPILKLIERCSSFQKVIRIVIYIRRFIKNWFLPQESYIIGPKTVDEHRAALECCIKLTQLHYFHAEIRKIEMGEPCTSKLRQLTPYISSDGFVRVGGRLKNSPLAENAKHPLLIPNESPLATLICDYYHTYTLHGGPRVVRALIQRNYWIPQITRLIRTRLTRCKICFEYKAKPEQPQMGDLPPERFSCDRCFTNTAIDYCGPFSLKESILPRNTRTTKAYVAVMVCMSTKAIHLEPVSSLSTEACLSALDRFISRRGLPTKIFSDQGRNFVGCDRVLREVQDLMKTSGNEIVEQMSQRGIEWKFSPPYAPNFNGLAEAGVKSTKHHMKRVIGTQAYTFEEFYTLLARIEAILNSRPLCSLSNSTDDSFDFLTPGHFLTGAPLLARPEVGLLDVPRNRLSRWQLISRTLQEFWRKWKQEYLHTIIHRSKWTNPTPNVHVEDLVLLYDPQAPPHSWPLGRVVEVYRGEDRAVRVAKVRTPSGFLTRPVNRLVVLPKN